MPASAALLDPRTTLARPDLAEQALEGIVRASTFHTPAPMHGSAPVANLVASPDAAAERIDQLLFGEAFDVLDRQGDFAWGRARRDRTVGWVAAADLAPGAPLPTHRVAVLDGDLPLNALVIEGLADVDPDDLEPVGLFEDDPVEVAEALIGTPHGLGARSSFETDCSGLVQMALYACGVSAPRHSDQQAQIGEAVDRADARRGDLAVWLNVSSGKSWTGHSAFVFGPGLVIHATGHHGEVVVEGLAEAEARYRADGFSEPVFRRL